MKKYTYSIYTFTDKKIDAICYLLKKRWSGLDSVDRRKLSKQVQDYALVYGLLAWKNGKLVYAKGAAYAVSIESIPVECLKRLVFPMLNDKVTGIDVVKDTRWEQLCITCYAPDGPSTQSMELVNRVLSRLHKAGCLKFYNGGDVWEIHTERMAA